MRNAIVSLVGTLSISTLALTQTTACKDESKEPQSAAQVQSAAPAPAPAVVTVEEVRTALLERAPSQSDVINSLIITSDGSVITLRGRVQDEQTHQDLINRVRTMPNVRAIRDEIQVQNAGAQQQPQQEQQLPQQQPPGDTTTGTTTTTGAAVGAGAGGTTTGAAGTNATNGKTVNHTDAVRKSMIAARPKSEPAIHQLTIMDLGNGLVVVSGAVPDDATHEAIIRAARETPGVARIQDDVKVKQKK